MGILEVDPTAAMELVDGSGAILLDVREDDEWIAGHAPGALHVRLRDLDVRAFDSHVPVVTVCRSGSRSGSAAEKLAGAGVTVYNMAGGMKAWRETGQPVIRNDGDTGTVV